MSTSHPQNASGDGEGRSDAQRLSPLRLRVPQLSSEATRPIELLSEGEDIAPASHAADAAAPPAPLKLAPVDDTLPEAAEKLQPVAAEVLAPPEAQEQEEVKASAVGRRLRFDPPSTKAAPAAMVETNGKPPYMATSGWKARILMGALWASGGALATAAVIVIGLFLVRSGSGSPAETGADSTTPVRWSQESEAPLRTARPEGQDLSQHSAPPSPQTSSPRATGQLRPYEPVELSVEVATEPRAQEPLVAEPIDPADLPLEAPVRPPVAEEVPANQPPQPPGPSSVYSGVAPTGRSQEVHNPYCTPPPVVSQYDTSQYAPASQAAVPGMPALPADVPSPHETYPRTRGSSWKFTPSNLAARESLRTSMRPAGDSQPGVAWPPQGRGDIDGGQYRLQGTIDNIPLR